jgi:hypothetical protein
MRDRQFRHYTDCKHQAFRAARSNLLHRANANANANVNANANADANANDFNSPFAMKSCARASIAGNISVAVAYGVIVRATYLRFTACNLNNFKIRQHRNTQGLIRGRKSARPTSWVGYFAKNC